MKTRICKTARNLLLKSAVASLAAMLSLDAGAQLTPAQIEEMVEYAQCIRANGYAEFPDPGPDGRMRLNIATPAAREQFGAAQPACADKVPSGMAAMNAPMTPERLEALLSVSACMREGGVADFPDPNAEGTFLLGPTVAMRFQQAQDMMQTCIQSNPGTGVFRVLRAPQ
jgi:hypothetical protein